MGAQSQGLFYFPQTPSISIPRGKTEASGRGSQADAIQPANFDYLVCLHAEARPAFEALCNNLLTEAMEALDDMKVRCKLQWEIDCTCLQGVDRLNFCLLIFAMNRAQFNQLTAQIEKLRVDPNRLRLTKRGASHFPCRPGRTERHALHVGYKSSICTIIHVKAFAN
ncbi:MAG: hypothetical protein HHJ12_17010 [Glaciimonas sp.]|nr:hypothetical protein [Glaciimonas sp.]